MRSHQRDIMRTPYPTLAMAPSVDRALVTDAARRDPSTTPPLVLSAEVGPTDRSFQFH